MANYPHMCRDDHIEIGHSDSENERCPLCRAMDALQFVVDGWDSQDINHAEFRVSVGIAANETLEGLRSAVSKSGESHD